MSEKYDVAVIGGGPAGYVAAIQAAMLGGNVVLFERDVVGGTCLNRGCIPTKTYVKTAEVIEQIHNAKKRGIINDPKTSVNMGEVVSNKNRVVKQLTGGVASLLKSRGVKVVNGSATLEDEHTIACGSEKYAAENILLCGGSMAGRIPIPGVDLPGVMTSDDILDLTDLPARLCVIGGGVIGCEIATAFAAFGSEVTIIEAEQRLIPMMDAELSGLMLQSLQKQGIRVMLAQQVSGIEKTGSTLLVKNHEENIECDKVLLSVGRKADLTCLGGLKDRIAMDRGYVKVSDDMRTSIANIYAPGDINGRSMLAHAAFKMGEAAAKNAMGHKETCDLKMVPSCVYTLPEASSVGLTEEEADAKYPSGISVGRFPFMANGRALASGEATGMIKVIIDSKYGEILGVHMFGPTVTELIAEATALMVSEVTAHEVADTIHPHPTCSEAFMEACADALGRCIHLPKK